MRIEPIAALSLACCLLLLAACQVTPTPTVIPIPTATFIPTETEAPTETATPTESVVESVTAVVTDTLRVREQPSTSARILGRLKKDTVVTLRARKDDNQWYAIEYPPDSGQPGWIAADIVVPKGPANQLPIGFKSAPPPAGAVFANVLHLLNVRAGPGKDYDVIATLPVGARIPLLSRSPDGQWYQIYYPPDSRKRAWILGESLELLGSLDKMPVATPPPIPTPAPTPIPRPTRTPGATTGALSGHLLMTSNRAGSFDIYSVADNGTVRAGLTHVGNAFGARYSPDGNRIVFYHIVSTSPVIVSHIYRMNADGSGLSDLSAGASASDSDPDWSPDGKRIAFVRAPRASAPEIWVMSADGTGAHRVVGLSDTTSVAGATLSEFSPQPRWSPDGGRLAYAAAPRTKNPGAPLFPNIFIINANGSGETQLTDNDLINSNPVWSPDGKQIAWSAKDFINRQNWRVWVMSAAGGNQHLLIGSLFGDANNGVQVVEWLGSRLLLAGWTGNWNMLFANADGSGITPVTRESADDKATDWLP